jgi:hypothetical protein
MAVDCRFGRAEEIACHTGSAIVAVPNFLPYKEGAPDS